LENWINPLPRIKENRWPHMSQFSLQRSLRECCEESSAAVDESVSCGVLVVVVEQNPFCHLALTGEVLWCGEVGWLFRLTRYRREASLRVWQE
jgi:hypothetical protein